MNCPHPHWKPPLWSSLPSVCSSAYSWALAFLTALCDEHFGQMVQTVSAPQPELLRPVTPRETQVSRVPPPQERSEVHQAASSSSTLCSWEVRGCGALQVGAAVSVWDWFRMNKSTAWGDSDPNAEFHSLQSLVSQLYWGTSSSEERDPVYVPCFSLGHRSPGEVRLTHPPSPPALGFMRYPRPHPTPCFLLN